MGVGVGLALTDKKALIRSVKPGAERTFAARIACNQAARGSGPIWARPRTERDPSRARVVVERDPSRARVTVERDVFGARNSKATPAPQPV